jgi:hypothetical protein
MMIYGGLQVARGGDRPLKHWPALRRIFRP